MHQCSPGTQSALLAHGLYEACLVLAHFLAFLEGKYQKMCDAEYWLLSEQASTRSVALNAAGFRCRKGAEGGYLTVPEQQSASLFLESGV